MLTTHKQLALPTRALELISRKCHVSQMEVTRLYEDELAHLRADARITSFLPIFAMRKVEESLHHRRSAGFNLAVGQTGFDESTVSLGRAALADGSLSDAIKTNDQARQVDLIDDSSRVPDQPQHVRKA